VSFAARLIHSLTLVSAAYSGTDDEYGQPATGTVTSTAVKGLVQPKTPREVADYRSAGVAVADHTIFLQPMALSEADHFLHGSNRLEIVGIRNYAFGRTPHLEVDARRIGDEAVVVEGS